MSEGKFVLSLEKNISDHIKALMPFCLETTSWDCTRVTRHLSTCPTGYQNLPRHCGNRHCPFTFMVPADTAFVTPSPLNTQPLTRAAAILVKISVTKSSVRLIGTEHTALRLN